MEKVQYPAILVLSRRNGHEIRAYADTITLYSDAECQNRLDYYRALEQVGAIPYTFTLANVNDVDSVIAERRAELEAEIAFSDHCSHAGQEHRDNNKAGNAPTSPASSVPPSEETNHDDSTTEQAEAQVATVTMTVRYQGQPPTPINTFATGQIVTYDDGDGNNPPAHSLPETRNWLRENGYRPDYTQWLLPAGSVVRQEVYIAAEAPEAPSSALTDICFLAREQGLTAPAITDEQRSEWRAIAQAQRGESDNRMMVDPFYRQTWSANRDFGLRATGGLGG